jgi:purine-binding chemotaxis protein CheW
LTVTEDTAPAVRADKVRTPAASALPQRPNSTECLTLRLGFEEYGIEILRVQEIRGYEPPTRIANAPAFIKGVVNLRGVIVPIIDLRIKFGLEHVAYDALTVTVILNVGGRVVGAVVDSVSDVVELQREQIRPMPDFNAALDADFITGIATIDSGADQRMLILIDIQRLLASADMGLGPSPAA